MTASELCQLLGGEIEGDPEVSVHGPSRIEEGVSGTFSFLANPKYESFAYTTQASVILVNRSFTPSKPVAATLIKVDDVYSSLGFLLNRFQVRDEVEKGISSLAFIHPDAKIADSASIGAFAVVQEDAVVGENSTVFPHAFIGKAVKIGNDVRINSGVKIYHHCQIGDRCVVHANTVIGSDGFGFSQAKDGTFDKIAQVGIVILEPDVEVGANTVIDRATMGATILRRGVKLDNLIQIAHNVEVGENSAIAAQAGVAGSTKLGKGVMVGGQTGFVGHIQVADGVQVQAQSGVARSVKQPNAKLYGSPSLDYTNYLKSYAVFKNLPELQKKVHELERLLHSLRNGEQSNGVE